MTPATSSSSLVPNPISQQPCIPPNRDDWDHLFQPMFDEYFNPPTFTVSLVHVDAAPRALDLADYLVSTSIDQDVPLTHEQEHSPSISQGFEESRKTPTFRDDLLHESLHEDSTSKGSSSNIRQTHTSFESLGRWTKDHPITNVISDPSCSISTRKELQTDTMWCYSNAFLTFVEAKNFKQPMTKPSWIDAMQEEIYKFERIQGFRKEEGIDFEESFAPVTRIEAICEVDPTLFTRKAGNGVLLVQIYNDDIIFASTNTGVYNEFANLMTTKFKMSMIGKMSFFLGLQISQSPKGIFLNEFKYAFEIVKKYGKAYQKALKYGKKDLLIPKGNHWHRTLGLEGYRIMSSIITQQAKLDLKHVPKEKRLEIKYCNRSLNPRKIQKEPTFQVVFNALALTLCYSAFLITAYVPEMYMHSFWDTVYKHDTFYRFKIKKRKRFKLTLEIFRDIFKICPRVHGQDFDALPTDEEIMSFLRDLGHTGKINSLNDVVVDHMHQPWRNFAALINKSLSRKTTGHDKLHKTLSWRNKIGMHTSMDDYLINTLRFVSTKEETQIYGAILPESLTIPEMKETQAYQTYLVSIEAPTRKSKRVKRPAKKSTKTPARGVVIRETHRMPLSKKKEKITIDKCKGIDLLFKVALTKEAQFKEVQKKSMRDFDKTHPSGSGTVTKTALSVAKIKPSAINDSNNEQVLIDEDSDQEKDNDDDKTLSDNKYDSDSEHETNESESSSESDHDESEENEEDDDDEDETKTTDKAEGDKDEEIDFTTKEDTNAAMTNTKKRSENPEILQVIKDAHVTLSIVAQKIEVPATSSFHSSDLATKFLNFLDIPHTDAEIVSPLDVHVHHEVPSQQTSTLLTVVISDSSLVFSIVILQSLRSFTPPPQQSSPTPPPTTEATNPQSALLDFASVFQFNNRVTSLEKELGATRDEFMNFLLASITTRITGQVKNQLPQILPEEVSNFAPPIIQSMVIESLKHAVLAKESSQPQSSYEAAATLTEFELKKILIDKIEKSESYLAAPEHRDCYEGLKKSYDLDMTFFSTYGKVYSLKRGQKDKDKDEEPSAGSDRGLKKRKTSKDAESAKDPKAKESQSSSSKGEKDKSKSYGKYVQSDEPEFEVADSDMPHDQEETSNNDDEPKEKVASKRDRFTKPTQPQEPTDPD
nr:integrase, catalytic region, zinc finger, CCHC-type, peptidase aspartic, catalytic [Tanacetum cinerariifolium]